MACPSLYPAIFAISVRAGRVLGSQFCREFAGVTGLVFKAIRGRDGCTRDFGRDPCVYILRLAHEFQSFYLAFGELDRADARRVVGKIEAKAPDLGRIDAPENARRVAGDHRDATPFVLAILAADH